MSNYTLQLSDGQKWTLLAGHERARIWVDRLASIINVQPGVNGHHTLLGIIRSSQTISESLRDTELRLPIPDILPLPLAGWSVKDLGINRFYFHEAMAHVMCDIGDQAGPDIEYLKMALALYPLYEYAQKNGGIPVHAAVIEKHGQGIVLGAPGGIGKSTCCRRVPPPWRGLCDDETLLLWDTNDMLMAHPLPTWSDFICHGSSSPCTIEEHVPVKAICFLEQAAHDEIIPIGQGQAVALLSALAQQASTRFLRWSSPSEVTQNRSTLFNNAADITVKIHSYILRVSADGSFWTAIDQVLDEVT